MPLCRRPFCALSLATGFFLLTLGLTATHAYADTFIVHRNTATRLTESNVRAFREDVENIATGKQGMAPDKMAAYFQEHVSDDARFRNIMHVALPGQPVKDDTQTLDKGQYIESVIASIGATKDYTGIVNIESVEISNDGHTALLRTVTQEHAKLADTGPDGKTQRLIPVASVIACDETLILTAGGIIQMRGADCKSTMKIDPWNGQPLTAPVQ